LKWRRTEKEGESQADSGTDGRVDEESLNCAVQFDARIQLSREATLHLLLGHFECEFGNNLQLFLFFLISFLYFSFHLFASSPCRPGNAPKPLAKERSNAKRRVVEVK
jgi:hypothetical protein